MRLTLIAAVVAAAALAPAARAQQSSTGSSGFASGFTGVSRQNLSYKPIDVTAANSYKPATAALTTRFNFESLFSKLIYPSAQKVTGRSNLPSPSSFPTYQNFKLIQKPAYQLGNINHAGSIGPMAPFIPSSNTAVVGPGSGK